MTVNLNIYPWNLTSSIVLETNGMINMKLNAQSGSSIISPVILKSSINSMPITINVECLDRSGQKGNVILSIQTCIQQSPKLSTTGEDEKILVFLIRKIMLKH